MDILIILVIWLSVPVVAAGAFLLLIRRWLPTWAQRLLLALLIGVSLWWIFWLPREVMEGMN
jgi:hypothetical protein